jgi:4-hydroxymandelate oxidase
MAIHRRELLPALGGLGLSGCGLLPRPRGDAGLEGLLSVADFEATARQRLSENAYAYVAGGAGDEVTVRWNREAFERLGLRPRTLIDVSSIDTRVTLLGLPLPHPILLAPTGYHRMFHPEGEIATVKGAGAARALLVVSSSATTPIEPIARAATQPLWFQLYMQKDRGFVRDLVARAGAAGCKALVLTVDAPVAGARNRERRAAFVLPPGIEASMNPLSNQARRSDQKQDPLLQYQRFPVTWSDLDWLRSITRLPVLLKGILDAADAGLAVRAGAGGIIVSNHGGRYLDSAPATLDALPAVADEVAGRVPVLMDGGIRRGTDVLKALGRGASAVLIGRPYVYGLGAAGAAGVQRVVDILRVELEMAMALTGRPTLAAIDRSVVGG